MIGGRYKVAILWKEEFPSLHDNREEAEMVMMVDPSNPQEHWPLGRVQEVFPDPDGKVRVVHIRPITKLCLLET